MTPLGLILLAFALGAAVTAYFARRHGFRQGYQLAFAQQEIAADDLRAELHDVEQQMWALGQQQRRAA